MKQPVSSLRSGLFSGLFWGLVVINLLVLAYFNVPQSEMPVQPEHHEPIHPDRIRLLSPTELQALPLKPLASDSMAFADAVDAGITSCYEWGSFTVTVLAKARSLLDSMAQSMEDNDMQQLRHIQLRYVEKPHMTARYWVYIPPSPSLAEAQRMMAELASRGVSDSFVMQEGEWQYAISLGLFKEERLAERLLQQLKQQGVENARQGVKLQPSGRKVLFMTDVSPVAAEQLYAATAGFKDSELKQVLCQ
ncbi:SPOR domain-containing protein [Methylobacillus flagellatus]|uniref:SPOR domain-containing protein n=1 Tax=Methylobacillus flagellatus TaxID=405 RepID=UPI001BB2B030|nr:SPOR domain-containing protein [Methylobacillus flagellatus]